MELNSRGVAPSMTHRSSPPSSASAVEDFIFDSDAPPSFGPENDNGVLHPDWVWVLVRASKEPNQQVWVRYPCEEAPDGFSVRTASPPREGEDGVRILPRRPSPPAMASSVDSTPGLTPFLSHVRAVAESRREILTALARDLEQQNHDAVIEHARALVGG